MEVTFEYVTVKRAEWIEYLSDPDRKKAIDTLDRGGGFRCCLGHGCAMLNLPKVWHRNLTAFLYLGERSMSPYELRLILGLRGRAGELRDATVIKGRYVASLAALNDYTTLTPQQIAKYIRENYTNVFLTREEWEAEFTLREV